MFKRFTRINKLTKEYKELELDGEIPPSTGH